MENSVMKFNYAMKGFSLVEALVACGIFGIAFIGFLSLSTFAVNQTQMLIERTKTALLANVILEDMIINQENVSEYNEHNFIKENPSGTSSIKRQKENWSKIVKRLAITEKDKSSAIISVKEVNDANTGRKKKQVIIEIKSLNDKVKVRVGRIFNTD